MASRLMALTSDLWSDGLSMLLPRRYRCTALKIEVIP